MTTDNYDQALEARARELLVESMEAVGFVPFAVAEVRKALYDTLADKAAIRAIIAALREGQKAGGQEAAKLLHSHDEVRQAFNLPEYSHGSGASAGIVWRNDGAPLSTTPEPPPGYALVPVEPTEEMLVASGKIVFREAGQQWEGSGGFAEDLVMETQRQCYAAMIAAAGAAGGE